MNMVVNGTLYSGTTFGLRSAGIYVVLSFLFAEIPSRHAGFFCP
jgi:hypothetical protein